MSRAVRFVLYLAVPAVVFGLGALHAAVVSPIPYVFASGQRALWAAAYASLLVCAFYIFGVPAQRSTFRAAALNSLVAVVAASVAMSAVQLLVGNALLPRFVVFGSAALLVPLATGLTALHGRSTQRDARRDKVYFVGEQSEEERLNAELAQEPERPALIVGAVRPEVLTAAGTQSLRDAVAATNASLIVLDLHAQARPEVVAQAAVCHEEGVRIRTLSLFYEEWLGKLPVSELERVSLLFDIGELHRAQYARAKRVLDVLVAALGLGVLMLVVPLAWMGNRFGNRGPLFFTQQRVGKGGSTFSMTKLRTMIPDSSDGSWTRDDDPRVTTFGGFLRRSHLDELPQVINVLRGELSLIGPRPEQVHYVEELSEKLPFYRLRHIVRPGLTGWAQVKYGYAADDRDALEKLQYEFFYLRRQSLALDLRILARTARHLVERGGR